MKRVEIDPGKWSTPVHRETGEEEIFYLLGGSGICLQDDAAYDVRPGDCLVFLAAGPTHSLRAGPDGLDVLAYGTRASTEIGHLPRAGVAWLWRTWTEVGGGEHPWEREAAAGEPDVPELSDRPENVVHLEAVEGEDWKLLARTAGAQRTGLNWGRLAAGEVDTPHCHSAEEEIFVVLEGSGWLDLVPSPVRGGEPEEHAVRAGHVVSRPAGTGIAHGWRAGDDGMTLLVYGTREPNDICYYPRSNKIFFRGVGLVGRLEPLPYDD